MKTIIEIILDEFRGEVMIIERGADAVWYPVSTDSYESLAEDIGEAVRDYLLGLG